ncbi:hypothetical protein M432DRAFT_594639 [Thermoascus aurantiacus ATCC 26904]
MGTCWTQLFPSSPPPLKEKTLPSQSGKVFIVTGATSGIGFELARILYAKGGKVYIAARDEGKARAAIEAIVSSCASSAGNNGTGNGTVTGTHEKVDGGELEYLYIDLADLRTIKPAAETLRRRETKIDVLWNNAGVAMPPEGSVSAQGYELQLATNCLGPFLFTKLLLPLLAAAAAAEDTAPDSVRIIWSSSIVVDTSAPEGGVPDPAQLDSLSLSPTSPTSTSLKNIDKQTWYAISKAGNWLLASEFNRRYGPTHRIVSVTHNPGIIDTGIFRHSPKHARLLLTPLIHDRVYGAYTALWAGLADEVTVAAARDNNSGGHGGYVIPWGRWHPAPREDILASLRGKDEDGGTGRAAEFWEWCDEKTRGFA